MLYKEYIVLKEIALHIVGNKLNQEEIQFSKSTLSIEDSVSNLLLDYFLSPFKSEEYYHFHHDTDLNLNETFIYVSKIFMNRQTLYHQSKNLAKHLYNQSVHPRIKVGEFYVVYLQDCILNEETCDAVGLFKSENKETYLQVRKNNEGYDIESQQGINIHKLDKGCLIFNTKQESGFVLSIIDNTNKGAEAQYWKDEFLGVQPMANAFHQTNQFLGIAKNFVTKQLEEEFEMSKADKIELLNRSVEYFKSHESFNKQEFETDVFQDSEIIKSFRNFDNNYRHEYEVSLTDNFGISQQAVKKQARVFKNVIRLDKNFHIYIHGNQDMLEQGIDQDGRKYYKIYYEQEN